MKTQAYDKDFLDVGTFMALPDEKKICFFVRTYPNADGSKTDYQDHAVGVYHKELLSYPNLQCESCGTKKFGRYIGTDDSCHEPVFCDDCYVKINSVKGYCGQPSEFYYHFMKHTLPKSEHDEQVEEITKIIDDSTESDIEGKIYFNTDTRSIAKTILETFKQSELKEALRHLYVLMVGKEIDKEIIQQVDKISNIVRRNE